MPYLNSLEKSKMYLDTILELFNRTSLTEPLNSASQQYNWMGADELKVLMIKTNGLGDYQKDIGYPQGSIEATWETMKLVTDRGVKFLLDRVDNDEVLALTMGRVAEDFTKFRMVPELDAYRLAKYANGAGEKVTGALTATSLLTAINTAKVHMNCHDVPVDSRILFINQDLELAMSEALNRVFAGESSINTEIKNFNGMRIVYVPSNRFQTKIMLKSGEDSEWGYEADPTSVDINFMLLYPKLVVQAAKVANGKFISADDPGNEIDSHKFLFRIYHDAFVIDPLKDGVYVHTK
jgi:hypothetical protein